jgi:nucleoredoxin
LVVRDETKWVNIFPKLLEHRADIMASLLPASLVDSKNQPVASSTLSGKYIGLYFSAHWCPPCRGFTPKLAEWFANFKASHAQKNGLELVFVSSDRDQASFDEYRNEMNFHAIPFADRAAKERLSKQFQIRGIPTLIILAPDGTLVTRDGRDRVMDDPAAADFPWTPKPLTELLGESFVDNKGTKHSRSELAGKYIGLYFSAHWCGPCRAFTPRLIQTYTALKQQGKPFELVFLSSDRSEDEFKEYFATMPWLSTGLGDARKQQLSNHFEVQGIPTLVILDPELNVVNDDGRGAVSADPTGANFPWRPKPPQALNPLDDEALKVVNDFPFLLALTDGSDAAIAQAVEALTPSADAEFAKPAPTLKFFYLEDPDSDILGAIRRATRLSSDDTLAIIDVQSHQKYIAADPTMSEANVTAFVNAFLGGTLQGTDF